MGIGLGLKKNLAKGVRPLLVLLCTLLFCSPPTWAGEVAQQDEEKVVTREVTGTISAVSRQGIAVEFARTRTGSSEMYLPLGDRLNLERVRNVSELKAGDTVKVGYEQTLKETKEGPPLVLKTVATAVTLLRRAPEEGALVSKEEVTE